MTRAARRPESEIARLRKQPSAAQPAPLPQAVSGAPAPEHGLHRSMLTKQDYLRIRDALDFKHDLRIVVLTLVVNQALFAAGLWLLQRGTWFGYLSSQFVFPIVFFQAFTVLHDCGHGSCLKRSTSNAVLGHLASVFCFMPYFSWKYQHALHHTWTGNIDRDPTLKLLRSWRATQRVPLLLRLAWRSWLPLAAAMQHLVFWGHPLDVWRSGTRWQLGRCVFSVLWLCAAYTGLHWAWPNTFNFSNFGLAIGLYLVAVEMVNLPHHADRPTTERKLPLWEQGFSTRSCYYPVFVSEFFVLNFNFHIEHHLFPSLPWYRLRGARSLVKGALQDGYEEAIGISWNLRNRSTDIRNVLRT